MQVSAQIIGIGYFSNSNFAKPLNQSTSISIERKSGLCEKLFSIIELIDKSGTFAIFRILINPLFSLFSASVLLNVI